MKWIKKGFIYGPSGEYSWAKNSALTPTPILIDDKIRVYAGFRDDLGVSRIGYVDLEADNPSNVLNVSKKPVLNVGIHGTFDDNGVILGDIVKVDEKLFMYYVGFQLVQKAKFLAFTGLAISDDNGNSFKRYSNAPILDRSNNELYISAIHSVLVEDNIFKVWYAAGNGWEIINGKPFPQYNIKYIESEDGIHFSGEGKLCVDVKDSEYRIGRPRVYKKDDLYQMFYTKGTLEGDYFPGFAESTDGIDWKRMDHKLGISLSKEGWDSKTLCYPALLTYKNETYMFYNGNAMGKDGFGYAVLEK
nr:hypothetical protein [uncultured Methanobacterium sp.]